MIGSINQNTLAVNGDFIKTQNGVIYSPVFNPDLVFNENSIDKFLECRILNTFELNDFPFDYSNELSSIKQHIFINLGNVYDLALQSLTINNTPVDGIVIVTASGKKTMVGSAFFEKSTTLNNDEIIDDGWIDTSITFEEIRRHLYCYFLTVQENLSSDEIGQQFGYFFISDITKNTLESTINSIFPVYADEKWTKTFYQKILLSKSDGVPIQHLIGA
jgi:hypothetical protein